MEKTCPYCKKKFLTHPAVANQQHCGSADCQKGRNRKWHKEEAAPAVEIAAGEKTDQAPTDPKLCPKCNGYYPGVSSQQNALLDSLPSPHTHTTPGTVSFIGLYSS
jgi:hypothetical protein